MALSPNPTSPEPAKKRRRRVPASGASEDCGGCRKRGIQCDRRRPYCTQCLESSTDCPGYRTTLTWGVGVASRGKFRGCSLPVQPSSTSPIPTVPPANPAAAPQQRPRANTTTAASAQHSSHDGSPRKRMRLSHIATDPPSQWPPHLYSAPVPFTNPFSPAPYSPEWLNSPASAHRLAASPPSLQSPSDVYNQHTPHGTTFQSFPWAASPHYYHDADSPAASEISYPRTPSTTQPFSSYFPSLVAASAAPTAVPTRATVTPLSSWSGSHTDSPPTTNLKHHSQQGGNDFSRESLYHSNFIPHSVPVPPPVLADGPDNFRPSLTRAYSAPQGYRHVSNNHTDEYATAEERQSDEQVRSDSDRVSATDWPPPLAVGPKSVFYQLHPRLQYLLDYYDKAICPVLVDADAPSNPYRCHVMPLAFSSTSLQSAIGALVTNNLRMRKLKSIPRFGPHGLLDRRTIEATIGMPDAEEQHYKKKAIQDLNIKLADPAKAVGDDVLATLLILSLFHCADSGFSKFKVQQAGVQKLLKMRGPHRQSEFVGWVELFFGWWDCFISSISDRETLLHGGSLDILNLSKSLGDVEKFSGCDGRLFKLFARLSRLNLLSQSRPVKNINDKDGLKAPQPRDFYSLPRDSPHDGHFFVGSVDTRAPSPPVVETCPDMDADARRSFWAEWHDIRDRLLAWQSGPPDCAPEDETESERRTRERAQHDKDRMSEAFRSSALLYIERLANPSAPCDHPVLQKHVDGTLDQIFAIGQGSCMTKFLLFPLFLSGTEAVTEAQRNLIRSRCEEIFQESGFYNNVSGLEVLEKIWAEGRDPGHDGGQAFRWRKCMERADGEYIVI